MNNKIGTGIHIPQTNTNIVQSIEEDIPISAAEITAIKIAIETCLNQKIENITIFTDSKSQNHECRFGRRYRFSHSTYGSKIVPNCRSVDIFLATVDHRFQDAAVVLDCFSVFGETSCKIASTWPETETGLYSGAAAMK
jgi:hypothetical protein